MGLRDWVRDYVVRGPGGIHGGGAGDAVVRGPGCIDGGGAGGAVVRGPGGIDGGGAGGAVVRGPGGIDGGGAGDAVVRGPGGIDCGGAGDAVVRGPGGIDGGGAGDAVVRGPGGIDGGQWRIRGGGGGGGGVQGVWTPPPSNLNMNIISVDVSHVRYTFLRSASCQIAYPCCMLIHWLVLYFSSVNCEIRSRLVFIRKVNVFQMLTHGRNIEHSFCSYFDSCSIISIHQG